MPLHQEIITEFSMMASTTPRKRTGPVVELQNIHQAVPMQEIDIRGEEAILEKKLSFNNQYRTPFGPSRCFRQALLHPRVAREILQL
eukprot:167070-Amphidinium_carterae.1